MGCYPDLYNYLFGVSRITQSMKSGTSRLWLVPLLIALLCIVFPPRRDTDQGHDRDGVLPRRFLWSSDLYQGSGTSFGYLVARVDFERLVLEMLALGALSSLVALGFASRCRGGAHE